MLMVGKQKSRPSSWPVFDDAAASSLLLFFHPQLPQFYTNVSSLFSDLSSRPPADLLYSSRSRHRLVRNLDLDGANSSISPSSRSFSFALSSSPFSFHYLSSAEMNDGSDSEAELENEWGMSAFVLWSKSIPKDL